MSTVTAQTKAPETPDAAGGGPQARPDTEPTPVAPAGETPPDQDSEPPLSADDGSTDDDNALASPTDRPASPGALH